ncbi:Uu.00g108020.m01.CDS01 [Anthostomella pinea]|uniref:Uu.00g108020.m01.CDS01 n=1 Tax=Anthostomella pinea TaxID=933095 RepID=A0AAI8VEH1_9PEZI|nr:Uu.00g108020.m01.CDS01 [Anthostomella pinea]
MRLSAQYGPVAHSGGPYLSGTSAPTNQLGGPSQAVPRTRNAALEDNSSSILEGSAHAFTAEDHDGTTAPLPKRKRKRASNPCQRCRRIKRPCQEQRPRCSSCELADEDCVYVPGKRRGPAPKSNASTLAEGILGLIHRDNPDLENQIKEFLEGQDESGKQRVAYIEAEENKSDLVKSFRSGSLSGLFGASEERSSVSSVEVLPRRVSLVFLPSWEAW